MRLAHVSDLHIGMSDDALGHGIPSETVAEATARDLSGIAKAIDLVVVSGDITELADAKAFSFFEQTFRKIGLPVLVVPGNHDGPSGMRTYSASSKVFAGWNITNRVVEIGGKRFLGLDTCVEGATEGALDDEGLDLVAAEIGRDTASQLVIVMHHPPLLLGLERFDSFCRLEGRKRFMETLEAAREKVVVLSGHVHRPYTAMKGKLACFVAGSMVAPFDSALPFGDMPIRPTTFQDFYYIHDFGPGGAHVVTPQRVRELSR